MPYITSWERRGMEKGEQIGRREELLAIIANGLEKRFGTEGKTLTPFVQGIAELDRLRAIQEALWTAQSVDDVKKLLSSPAAG